MPKAKLSSSDGKATLISLGRMLGGRETPLLKQQLEGVWVSRKNESRVLKISLVDIEGPEGAPSLFCSDDVRRRWVFW